MKILKMTATFGCLDEAVLEPDDGLNTFVMPNESGKSTWAAFLTAMFYGVETGQRAAKGRVPDKFRYQPWSGRPMCGTVELERDGQILILQRTSERGRPMAVFRAWDRDTGLEIPGLTAENCGRKLLGVERAVFRRSAFLSGTELAVTQDQDLARRLGALAAAGRESDSYPQAEQKLKLWQNRCRYHKTGRIPETEEQLQKTRALLEEAEDLRRQRLLLIARLEQQRKQVKTLERQRRRERDLQEQQLREQLEQAHRASEQWAAKTAALPPEQELRQMQVRLGQLMPEIGAEPACPPALQGLTAEGIWPKAQRDLAEHDRLAAVTPKKELPFLFFGAAAAVFAAAAAWLRLWWLVLLLLGTCGFCCVRWLQQRRWNRQARDAAQSKAAILDSYGVSNGEALLTTAMTRRDWLLAAERVQRQRWETAVLLEEIRSFAPDVQTPEAGADAVLQALQQLEQCREAERTLERVRLRWENRAAETADEETERLRRHLIRMEAEKDSLLQQEQALGSWEELQSRAQKLEETLEDLTKRERALILAREALASANSQLAQVYAPQVTRLAATYLAALTQGRYDGLLLEPDLTLSVREASSGLVRQLSVLSRGTQDQVWLALRLSMTQLLLPADTPIVLDDALLTFDRDREQAALAVLRNENRQVLLFTCR